MAVSKGFNFLEHTADEYIMAYGADLKEAFESAALAMFEVITDTKTVKSKDVEFIQIEADDKLSLLYLWLENLLIKFDVDGTVFSKFKVSTIEKTEDNYFLEATIWGETFDPHKHPSRTNVKAITYYQMEILIEKNEAIVKYVLDI